MMNDHTSRQWTVRLTMIGGIILLVGAALLAVSILLAIFPLYGTVSAFAVPGHMLYSVYGFSAFLVPLFFLFAAIVLVIPGWSPRSGILLAGSFVPFFTIAGAEKLYGALGLSGATSSLAPVAGGGIALTALVAVALEYLFLLNLTDRLLHGGRPRLFSPGKFFTKREKKLRKTKLAVEQEIPAFEYVDDEPDTLTDTVEDFSEEFQEELPEEVPEYNDFSSRDLFDEPAVPADDGQNAGPFDAYDTAELETFDDADERDELMDPEDFADPADIFDSEDDDSDEDTLVGIDSTDTTPEVLTVPPLAPTAPVPAARRSRNYSIPFDILNTYPDGEYWVVDDTTRKAAAALKDTLNEFRIEADVTGIRKGPVITMFEILPAPGVKLSKIVGLQDNIALRLAASSVRIVAPIPGKHAVGIEVPNQKRAIVSFREIIQHDDPVSKKMEIPVILGKDITGEAQLLDLAATPHLLIAGSTGSGKSVCVNSIICSILYKRSPEDVRLILIDPKIVELKLYNDIRHLLSPVITEPKKAFQSLQYCLCEMERRYALLDSMGVRDIKSYNRRILERKIATEKLPYLVVIIDEFADLMATTGKELESTVARLCAMSRAVGIHLVLATQRPSIDVITGLIKANIPSRIAFMVASKMDSRIIIDQVGAEKLLGRGDMLYTSATDPFPVRIQGAYVSEEEVERVVEVVKTFGEPDYIDEEIFVDDEDDGPLEGSLFNDGDDPLYDKALEIVLLAGKASASYIQRRLKIGYNRAARLVEEMEQRGIVGPANGSKPREVIHHP